MKKLLLFALSAPILLGSVACKMTKEQRKDSDKSQWESYNTGYVIFDDKAQDTEGSKIYHRIIKNPEKYIKAQARDVLSTLYYSPKDSIVAVDTIHYTLENINGVSAKDGGNGVVSIFYSTQHIEKSFQQNDTTKLLFETRGVLLHELTHAYQLEPQGIGNYSNSRVFWAFIEGMADAVRIANGGFCEGARPKGGNYMDGYRTTGYFFVWLRDNKDPEFLKKFNHSTLEIIPWSFDKAIKYSLGEEYDIDNLWHEYQVAIGDIQENKKQE